MRQIQSRVDWESCVDVVAAEEPLNIRLQSQHNVTESLSLTMRTPGNDPELVAGYLLAENIITARSDLLEIRPLGAELNSNDILAVLAPHVDVEAWRLRRSTMLSSSCGLCGKSRADAIAPAQPLPSGAAAFEVSGSLILELPGLLGKAQAGFRQTGGLHGAALFECRDAHSPVLIQSFEDIGRHNALDKLLGWCLLQDKLPLASHVLFLTSRGSFELVQKALAAQAGILAFVGSPSSLAVETARDAGLTLIGFVRDQRFNTYSGEWRIKSN